MKKYNIEYYKLKCLDNLDLLEIRIPSVLQKMLFLYFIQIKKWLKCIYVFINYMYSTKNIWDK